MNRVIKFRAWDDGRMYRESFCEYLSGYGCMFNQFTKPDALMQFTGLTDKDGVEIYEGDIVKLRYSDWLDETSTVMFRDGTYGFGSEHLFTPFSRLGVDTWRENDDHFTVALKVIGNIYENPELLGGVL